ncbi:MAG: SDR family oxidoreductase [Bacteroidetes bacterium]|nr:SDR family oxidoreductase [Bacteroidota bacterium]
MKEKVVIVTGSSQGIGKTAAIQLGQKGARVVLNGRNPEKLEKTRRELTELGLEVLAVAGDVSQTADCQKLIDTTIREFGQLDVLINNAGISVDAYPVEEIDPEVFASIVSVNLFGSVYPTQIAIPHLKKTRGSVLFIGSAAGIHGLPLHAAYSASKMSLTAVAESLRKEMKPFGVHVGLAYVGFTQNDPNKTVLDEHGNIIPLVSRSPLKPEPVEKVAARLIRMIEKRQFKRVFSGLGKLNYFMNRLFPGLVDRILYKNHLKEMRK